MQVSTIDLIIFLAFIVGTILFGSSFAFKNKSSSDFTKGGGSMPGFVVGMSIFATYVSSISFLALPGNAFLTNWNSFVFSLSIPIATFVAVKWFVPFYRNIQSVSAYSFLEERFGYWARIYAASCYLLTQVARIGSVIFLLALPLNSMMGWSIPSIIIATTISVTIYSVLGGIKAVIWTDAIQGVILVIGALVTVIILLFGLPGGVAQFVQIGSEYQKFSLGSMGFNWGESTFWVMLIYGIFINLQNYGIDQNYVQRYKSAKNLKSAKFSAMFGGLLYLPVSALFFLIGTGLFVHYQIHSGTLPADLSADKVFPWFIVHELPAGFVGLLIAAIFSAGMSTVSTSINSAATIIMTDFVRKEISEKKKMRILHWASAIMGITGMGVALAMMSVQSALDAWWKLAGIFSGGMLGLFLLGFLSLKWMGRNQNSIDKSVNSDTRTKSAYYSNLKVGALLGVLAGVAIIGWIALSAQTGLHAYFSIALGTLSILIIGFLPIIFSPKK